MSEFDPSQSGRNPGNHSGQLAHEIPSHLLDDGNNWGRVLAMTDEEAYRTALADEDSPPLTPEQLARMRRAPNLRLIRRWLGMTQKEFARQFQIPVGTLRDWEQGIHLPDSTATAFLRVIEWEAEAVLRALHPGEPEREGLS